MRIVLPFSFIYFYTVKNGRFFGGILFSEHVIFV